MNDKINQAITNLQAIANAGGASDCPWIEEMAASTADILSAALRERDKVPAKRQIEYEIPAKIYLQILDEDGETPGEVTWRVDRIHDTDIEYMRKKKYPNPPVYTEKGFRILTRPLYSKIDQFRAELAAVEEAIPDDFRIPGSSSEGVKLLTAEIERLIKQFEDCDRENARLREKVNAMQKALLDFVITCRLLVEVVREIQGKLVEIATPVMSGEQTSDVTMDGEVLPPCREEA